MSKFYVVILFFLFPIKAYAIVFSEEHLPISYELEKAFPKLNARSFIIANKKAGIVLHEKFSKIPMKFDVLLKNIFSSRNNGETNLYDICRMFCEGFLEKHDYPGVLKNVFNAKSMPFCIGENYGCAIKITNVFGEDFYCVLYGAAAFKDLEKDIRNIKVWLDQFFAYKATTAKEEIAETPIFYGEKDNYALSLNEDHYVLLSKNFDKTISKTLVYRTMLEAPIIPGDEIGVATYKTAIFKNSVTKPILAIDRVEKANRFKIILDSFSYIIFGAPYRKTKIRKIEDC